MPSNSSRFHSRPHTKEEIATIKKRWKKKQRAVKVDERRKLKKLARKLASKTNDNRVNSHDNSKEELVEPEAAVTAVNHVPEKETRQSKDQNVPRAAEPVKINQLVAPITRGQKMLLAALKEKSHAVCESAVISGENNVATRKSHDRKCSSRTARCLQAREIDPKLITGISEDPIGCGTFGACHHAYYRDIEVVVKKMILRNESNKEMERCRLEVLHESQVLLTLGDHPGLPFLLGICTKNIPYSIVLQYYGKTTLQVAIRNKVLKKIPMIDVFEDICRVLKYIHQKGYLHNDIKSNNVLLTSSEQSYRPILIDFGKSKHISKLVPRKRMVNVASYLAPEVIEGQMQSTASDIYSLGKMLEHASSNRSFKSVFDALIKKMLSTSPNNRPTTRDTIDTLKCIALKCI